MHWCWWNSCIYLAPDALGQQLSRKKASTSCICIHDWLIFCHFVDVLVSKIQFTNVCKTSLDACTHWCYYKVTYNELPKNVCDIHKGTMDANEDATDSLEVKSSGMSSKLKRYWLFAFIWCYILLQKNENKIIYIAEVRLYLSYTLHTTAWICLLYDLRICPRQSELVLTPIAMIQPDKKMTKSNKTALICHTKK